MSTTKVLFDTDPGIDDAMALALLAKDRRAELVGVTTVFGNASIETTTANALSLCERFGVRAPVARGAARGLDHSVPNFAARVHGLNGLGDVPLPPLRQGREDSRGATELISALAREHSGELVLLAVGPLTNLALTLQADPDLTRHVREVVVMGGAFGTHGHGVTLPPVAEANIANDPHAADQVFTADWPVTIVGLDITHEIVMDPIYLRALADSGDPDGLYLWEISQHYQDFYHPGTGGGIFSHDPTAAAYVLDPGAFTTRSGPVRVVTEGLARGQTIQWLRGGFTPGAQWVDHPDQRVCVDVDAPRLLQDFQALFRRA